MAHAGQRCTDILICPLARPLRHKLRHSVEFGIPIACSHDLASVFSQSSSRYENLCCAAPCCNQTHFQRVATSYWPLIVYAAASALAARCCCIKDHAALSAPSCSRARACSWHVPSRSQQSSLQGSDVCKRERAACRRVQLQAAPAAHRGGGGGGEVLAPAMPRPSAS